MKLIKDALEELNKKIKIYAAMPGHKGRIEINGNFDVTELEGADNLQDPQGVIENSQEFGKELYGVSGFRYIVNGSTSANLTMIFSYLKENDVVLVERNCHKSIYNGIILRNLNPIYMYQDTYEKPLDEEIVLGYIREYEKNNENKGKNIRAVVLTNPSYLGFINNYEKLFKELKKRNIKLLIDGAHGAHLIAFPKYREIYKNMDAMSISFHKTLGAPNQSAALLYNDVEYKNNILRYSNIFQSTSPSYLMLYYMEKALLNLKEGFYGRNIRDEFIKIRDGSNWNNEKTISSFYNLLGDDPYKLCINKKGYGKGIYNYLINEGIYSEMHDGDNVLLMLSPYNNENELFQINEIIEKINLNLIEQSKIEGKIRYPKVRKVLNPKEALDKKSSIKNLYESIGEVSFNLITPYPPGIPLLIPGEEITKEIVDVINKFKGENIEVNGLIGNNKDLIEVVVNEG